MGKVGKMYAGAGGRPISFYASESLSQAEERAITRELYAALAGLIGVLGFVGWAMTLVA